MRKRNGMLINLMLLLLIAALYCITSRPDAVTAMLIPPDGKTLERRLRDRGTETEEVILKRMARAREELALADKYDYVVVNHDGAVDDCAAALRAILSAEHSRSERMTYVTDPFFED